MLRERSSPGTGTSERNKLLVFFSLKQSGLLIIQFSADTKYPSRRPDKRSWWRSSPPTSQPQTRGSPTGPSFPCRHLQDILFIEFSTLLSLQQQSPNGSIPPTPTSSSLRSFEEARNENNWQSRCLTQRIPLLFVLLTLKQTLQQTPSSGREAESQTAQLFRALLGFSSYPQELEF